ncbi:hypothetical protein [Alcaligenes ammonioxydans]|uniref:hypothetical protein n=1 Tax=Alcaligenes ammonioxydans TaxID=2582914 RepID=UPI003D25E13D
MSKPNKDNEDLELRPLQARSLSTELALTCLLAYLATDKKFDSEGYLELLDDVAQEAAKLIGTTQANEAISKAITQLTQPMRTIVEKRNKNGSTNKSENN